MYRIIRFGLSLITLAASLPAIAVAPDGYYSSCEGKSGQELLKALAAKISDHTNVGYDGLWEVYKSSDVRSDGTLWDIYSTKRWPSDFTRCGNYQRVGDCVNREHSLPKSWWGGQKATQYSDAFHLYPTDGRVNGQRSNYPFGECGANGAVLASNGNVKPLGRLGNSVFKGYTGTVFEPDDEYKGDLARSYFYMAACYNDIIAGWTAGNGGSVFAGNSYPVFTTWSRELLLKWARQDEVSVKEIDRNEAIYSFQHNRNPFIDHPELVEYIWGDKVGVAWYPGGTREASFERPVLNGTIDFGQAAVGVPRTVNVSVKGRNLSDDVTLSVTGPFTVSPSSLTASQANAGTSVNLTLLTDSHGDAEGTLTLSSGTAKRTVDIMAEVIDGLPASISHISDRGFTVNWINLHTSDPAATYTLSVKCNGDDVAGFPTAVKASDETVEVSGLEPATTYTVTFLNLPGNLKAPQLSVTTAEPMPYIELLFDGTLHFDATPGEPSDVAELLIEAENIDSDITVEVSAPFELSTDKSTWGTSVTLSAEEDRFYMRTAPTVAGAYETSVTLRAGSYVNDDVTATVTVAARAAFLEDWEAVEDPAENVPCYSSTTFTGSACDWAVNNAGFGSADQDKAFNGTVVLRFGNNNDSSLDMTDDKAGGIGSVSFDAAKWNNSKEPDATVNLDYSADGGTTWTTIETFTITNFEAKTFTATVNKPANGRIRLRQTAGKRWFIDNIAISDFTDLGAVNQLDYHSWDAFCRDSQLIIECRDARRDLKVYGIDGICRFQGPVPAAAFALPLPPGLYIITDRSFSRRVVIK